MTQTHTPRHALPARGPVAVYKINDRRFMFVSVNPLYWVLSDAHGTTWHAYGPVIRPRMHLVKGDA